MPNVLDGLSSPAPSTDAKKTLVKCEWKDCKTTHENKPSYANDGVLTRSSGFAGTWVAAGLEPWVKYGPGTDSHATLEDYRQETPKAQYAAAAAAMKHPTYHTQKHHLISINLFKARPKLKHDAGLIGYDVNDVANGVCLPTYEVDIVQHDLQAHRGSHPNNLYNAKIAPLLKDIEEACVRYCESDTSGEVSRQKALTGDLERLSRKIEGRIRAWKWLLRTEAPAERSKAFARLASLRTGGN